MAWNVPPHAIRVVPDVATAGILAREAETDGAVQLTLDVAKVSDDLALEGSLSTLFQFPHRTVGFDAAIDLMSDLAWMPSENGYVFRVIGLDDGPPEVAHTLVSLLPSVIDRWRTQNVAFVAILVATVSAPAVLAAVAESNDFLARAGALPWVQTGTGPVPVITHPA
jgi:hypothetical protein